MLQNRKISKKIPNSSDKTKKNNCKFKTVLSKSKIVYMKQNSFLKK